MVSLPLAAMVLFLGQIAGAEPIPFPSSYQRFVNDTSSSVLVAYQQEQRERMIQLINRDPLIARKVLISFLRQPDKLDVARSVAELFPQSCELELEKPFFDFFVAAGPELRKRVLDSVERITDAEYERSHSHSSDRFDDLMRDRALSYLQQAAAELQAMGFADGEAYSHSRWAMYKSRWPDNDFGLEGLEKARVLYEKSGNLRGQAYCLLQSALRHRNRSLGKLDQATPLFLQACEIGKNEGSPILGHFLSRYSWLAPKSSVEWLKESTELIEKDPALRRTRYEMLLRDDTPVEKYQALLEEEADPVHKTRALFDLYRNLSDNDRQTQALEAVNSAIELARRQEYDMAVYGRGFFPAVPWMLNERAQSKMQLGMLREAESDCLEALQLLEQESSL
ncbi:MAG: hypothetical protein ACRD2L_06930, partial [Terriglobia bacterium]